MIGGSRCFTLTDKFDKPSLNIFLRTEFGDRPLNFPLYGSNTVTEFDSLSVRAGKDDHVNPFIKDELMRCIFINTRQVGSYGNLHTPWINGVFNTAERASPRVSCKPTITAWSPGTFGR